MQDIWNRIESWLKVNAPEIHSDLLPGAADEEVRSAEEHLGVKFPEDAKASFRIHNGQRGMASPLMGEWQLLPLENVMSQWDIMKGLSDAGKFANVKSKPVGPVRDDWWNVKWVPLAYNGAGDLQCLDFDPAPGGAAGQMISFWHMDEKRERLSNDFRSWLQGFADDLEAGKYKVEDGTLNKVE
jgi:cell wall assembly regulator SMI1